MINPILLCEVARLQHRDIEKEVALKQFNNYAKSPKFYRSGTIIRFMMIGFASTKNGRTEKVREALFV
jgi:hypothetical protein